MADTVRYRISTISYIDSGGGRNYMSGSTGVGYTLLDTTTSISVNYTNAEDESPYYTQTSALEKERYQLKGSIDDTFEDILTHYNGNRIFWHRWRVDYYTYGGGGESDFTGTIIGTSYYTALNSNFHPSPLSTNNIWIHPEVKIGDKGTGIQIKNNQSELMIDGEYNNHIVIDGGSVNLNYSSSWWTGKEPDAAGSSGHGKGSEGTITFSSTLKEPPLIAIRPHPVRAVSNGTGATGDEEYNPCSKSCPHDMRGLFIFGKLVGNLEDGFTGFTYLRTYTHKYHGIRFEWKALHPATAQSSEDYGFRVYDGLGDTGTDGEPLPIFDSGHQYMNIVSSVTLPQAGWNYIREVDLGSGLDTLYDPSGNYHGCETYNVAANPSWTSIVSVEDAYYIVNEAYHWGFHSYNSSYLIDNSHTVRMGIMVLNAGQNWYISVCGTVMTTTRGLSIFSGWAEPALPSGDYARTLPVCLLR